MTKRAYGWVLAAVVGLLAVPATAGAATYCVGSPGCVGTAEPDLQTALTAAQSSTAVADTVQVGNPGAPLATGYTYNDAGNAANQVDIVGAGRAQTVLTRTGTGAVLALFGPGSTVSHLTLRMPAADGQGIVTTAVVRDVDVSTVDPGTANQTGCVFVPAIGATPGWFGGTITLASGAGSQYGIQISTALTSTVQDVGITAQELGVIGDNGALTLRRVSLNAAIGYVSTGQHDTIDNVSYRPSVSIGAQLAFVISPTPTNDGVVDMNHVSAVGNGGANSSGVYVSDSTAGHPVTVNVRNSIIRNFATDIYRTTSGAGQTANVNLSYTDADLLHSLSQNTGGAGAINSGAGVIDENPHWVDAVGGNFNVPGNSPVVDAGQPGAAVAAGESTTDLAGQPRVAHGRTDMGALEFQPPIVSPPPPTPLPDTTAPSVTIRGLKSKLTLKQLLKGVSLTLTPSEAASLDVTMAAGATRASLARAFNLVLAHKALPLAAGGRKVKLKPSRKLLSGARKFKVRVAILATDRAGNVRSITKTISIKR